MKASKVASIVAALIATDAKPTEEQIFAAIIAADKKGKDGSPLGEGGVQEKDKARDEEMPEGMDAKAWDAMSDEEKKEAKDKARDEKDDPESTNDEDPDMEGMDDIQPVKSANGNSGAGGKEPAKDKAKDKKGMDARIQLAIDARDALHAARREVEPVLGVVTYDSAAAVYRAGLVKLGVAVDGIPPAAFGPMFKLARERAEATTPRIASDAAVVKGMAAVIPGYNRLP